MWALELWIESIVPDGEFVFLTEWMMTYTLIFSFSFSVLLQEILNNDDTSHVLENLDPDTKYVVTVTAIYPDESESEDLLGTERTCKSAAAPTSTLLPNHGKNHILHPQYVTHWINALFFSTSLSSGKGSGWYVIREGSVLMFIVLVGIVMWTIRTVLMRHAFVFLHVCAFLTLCSRHKKFEAVQLNHVWINLLINHGRQILLT